MDQQTSRRGVLGTFLKTAALRASLPLAAATLSQCSQPAHAAGAGALDAAIARYRAALAAEKHFDATIYRAAVEAHDGAEAKFDKTWPHTEHRLTGIGRTVTTADWRDAEAERSRLKGVRYIESCAWEDHRSSVAFVDAYDHRQSALHALPERVHMDAMTNRSDALMDVRLEARDAAAAIPATSLSEVLTKFDFLETEDWADGNGFDHDDYRASLRRDLERLLAGGLN